MNLPKPDQRVMVTGLFAGLMSNHVCVVSDATDEEILAECNRDELSKHRDIKPHMWTKVIRTQQDIDDLNLRPDPDRLGLLSGSLPGPCKECPDRLHIVVR